MFRGNCQKCGLAFITPLVEIPLHLVEPGIVLCWRCCKDAHWYEEARCSHCSEKTCCRDLFLINMKKALDKTHGI